MKYAGTHGMMSVGGDVAVAPGNQGQDSNSPIKDRISKEVNPDKQIEKTLGSVARREEVERAPAQDTPGMDLTSERLRKSSSILPEVEAALAEHLEKVSEDLLVALGDAVEAITKPKYAAAYAKVALENNITPHTHYAQGIWKSAVWSGTVADSETVIEGTDYPSMDDLSWKKMAAAQVVLGQMIPDEFGKEAWQGLVGDEETREKTFAYCEDVLSAR